MELEELIEIMSGARDGDVAQASDTLSWEAYNVAREINDLELFGGVELLIMLKTF